VGEQFVKVNFSELAVATFFCPACGTGLKFDLRKMPSLIGCARRIIGNLAEAFSMYANMEKFKVEFEVKAT
jgi:hypothetical protein